MKNNIRVERAVLRISQQELALKLSAYFGKTVNDIFSLD